MAGRGPQNLRGRIQNHVQDAPIFADKATVAIARENDAFLAGDPILIRRGEAPHKKPEIRRALPA